MITANKTKSVHLEKYARTTTVLRVVEMTPIVALRNRALTNCARIHANSLALVVRTPSASQWIMTAFAPALPVTLVIHGCSVNAFFHHLSAPPIHSVLRNTSARTNVVSVSLFYFFIDTYCFLLLDGCRSSFHCPTDKTCIKEKCVNPCSQSGACGKNTLCTPSNHVSICSCPSGFIGDPNIECKGLFWFKYSVYIVLTYCMPFL